MAYMTKLKALGRGLDALLSGDLENEASANIQALPVDALQPGKYQPRSGMDSQALAELADSIRAQGVLQPILVRPTDDGRYEIIAGERRWRAAQMAGLSSVPVAVRAIPDSAALAAALIENIQREDLNCLEEATGLQRLIDEFGMTHESAARAVGRSRSAVTNLLRLLGLAAPARELLSSNQIEMGHARTLLGLNAAKQVEVAHRIAKQGLSVREAERLAARESEGAAPASRPRPDRDVMRLQDELSDRLGTTVKISANKEGAGKLSISFASLAQLDELIAKLKG
jgi:ParB family transcriptional regulator, chromosome partitioning protein